MYPIWGGGVRHAQRASVDVSVSAQQVARRPKSKRKHADAVLLAPRSDPADRRPVESDLRGRRLVVGDGLNCTSYESFVNLEPRSLDALFRTPERATAMDWRRASSPGRQLLAEVLALSRATSCPLSVCVSCAAR